MSSTPSSSRKVWDLAWPIIVSNSTVPLVGLVDTAVMGHLDSPDYIGAVAVGAVIMSFVFWGFGFLRIATGGLVAQALGRNDGTRIRTVIGQGALIGVVCAAFVLVFQIPLLGAGLWVMEADSGLEGLTSDYFHIVIWAAPAVLLNYLVLGALMGLQSARAVLINQLSLNLTNIVLDIVFVVGLGWGIEGVAAASVIASWFALGLGILILRIRMHELPGRWSREMILDRADMRRLLGVNSNLMIRTLLLLGVFAWFTALGTRMGAGILAANAVLVQLLHVIAYGLDGFSHAVETLCGHAYGAKNRSAFDTALKAGTAWGLAMSVAFLGLFGVFGGDIVALITDIPEVRAEAAHFLPWLALAPLFSVWSYLLDGVFMGTTKAREMRNAMFLSVLAFALISHPAMAAYGNHGLWASLLAFNLIRALSLWPQLRGIRDEMVARAA